MENNQIIKGFTASEARKQSEKNKEPYIEERTNWFVNNIFEKIETFTKRGQYKLEYIFYVSLEEIAENVIAKIEEYGYNVELVGIITDEKDLIGCNCIANKLKITW